MKNTLIGLVLGIAISLGGYFAFTAWQKSQELDISTLPEYSTKYDKTANPHKQLSIALKKAKKENKPILLLVGGDWCKWCGTLDNFLDHNSGIRKCFYEKYEVVRVYYGKGINKEAQSLLKQFPVLKATPHFYILNSDAKLLYSVDSAPLEKGYSYDKAKFREFLETHQSVD